MTGSDWRNYETYYSWLSLPDGINSLTFEPGYKYLSLLFHAIGLPFWPFFIALKLVAFYVVIHFLGKYSSGNKLLFLCMTFFLFVFGLYFFIDNPMRNLLAICISYYAYKYLENREMLKASLLILLAAFFHISAVCLFLLIPFYPIKSSNKRIFIAFLLFNILIMSFYEFLVLKIIGSFSFIPLIESKMISYFLDGEGLENNSLISLGFIIQFIFLLLVLYKRKEMEKLPSGKLIFWGTISYIFLYRIAAIVDIFYRIQLYMAVFYCIGVCFVLFAFVRRNNKIVYATFLSCYLFYMTYALVTSSTKYVPYSSYISYMFSPELPFEYRSEYNPQNSPYAE